MHPQTRLLQDRRVPTAAAESCRALLAQLDEAMYRPGATALDAGTARSLASLLSEIDCAIDKPGLESEVPDEL